MKQNKVPLKFRRIFLYFLCSTVFNFYPCFPFLFAPALVLYPGSYSDLTYGSSAYPVFKPRFKHRRLHLFLFNMLMC